MSDPTQPRHIQMRRQYDMRRYMRLLSQDELDARIRDLILNMLRLTPNALVGLPPIDNEAVIWLEKVTHAFEEMQLRHGPYPAGFTRNILHREPIPNFASALAKKAANAMSSRDFSRGGVFIKFGKRKHMESLYENGELRVQAASYFRNSSHNPAVRDDEQSLPFSFALSRDDVVKLVKNPQDVPPIIPDQRLDMQLKYQTDYWLYCVTNSVEPRLFVDFDADACVVVRDKAIFGALIKDAGKYAFPGATLVEGPATYVDPLFPKSANLVVPLTKHFRYAYQDEYRFCWVPSAPKASLGHVDLKVGSLASIAEFIQL